MTPRRARRTRIQAAGDDRNAGAQARFAAAACGVSVPTISVGAAQPGHLVQRDAERAAPSGPSTVRGDVEEVIAVSLGVIAGELAGEQATIKPEQVRNLCAASKISGSVCLQPQQFGRDVGRVERIGDQVDQLIGVRTGS